MQKEKNCPRCGQKMEEFAVAWKWECCYDCSMKNIKKVLERKRKKEKVKLAELEKIRKGCVSRDPA